MGLSAKKWSWEAGLGGEVRAQRRGLVEGEAWGRPLLPGWSLGGGTPKELGGGNGGVHREEGGPISIWGRNWLTGLWGLVSQHWQRVSKGRRELWQELKLLSTGRISSSGKSQLCCLNFSTD